MIRIRKAIKRIAAISAMTLISMSALAGAAAAATYAVGPDADAASTALLTTGGEAVGVATTKEVCLGNYLAKPSQDVFDSTLEDDDIGSLQDTSIAFGGTNYNIHDEIKFVDPAAGTDYGPSIQTSLTGSDDDYKTDVYMHLSARSLGYYYVIDETVNVSASASSTTPLEIKFGGKTLEITSVTDDNTFGATIGTEYYMLSGESITDSGHTVTVDNVGDTSAVISVDGTQYTISEGATKYVGSDFEVYLKDTISRTTLAESAAILIAGKDATETINDGDPFRGGDDDVCEDSLEDLDCWEWDIDGLLSNTLGDNADTDGAGASPGFTIGVLNNYNVNDFSDDPITSKGSMQIADTGIFINFGSLSDDVDYATYTIEYESNTDLSTIYNRSTGTAITSAGNWDSSEPTILISASIDEGLELESDTLSTELSADVRTKKIWLHVDKAEYIGKVEFFYQDSNNRKVYAGDYDVDAIANAAAADDVTIFRGRYGSTKDTNMEFSLYGDLDAAADPAHLFIDVIDDQGYLTAASDDIAIRLGTGNTINGSFAYIGDTLDTEEADELLWGAIVAGTHKTIGTKDEDHRTRYGTKILNPKTHGASDEVVLEVPKDAVKAEITIGGMSGTAVADEAKTPTEIEKADITEKSILVGGPAANKYSAEAMGLEFPTYGADIEGWADGYCYIKALALDGKTVTVVAGWDADDTKACVGKYLAGTTDFAAVMS